VADAERDRRHPRKRNRPVASGFLLRVLGGAAATHVPPSVWFLLVCSFGALGVAVAKRYTKLVSTGIAAVKDRPAMRWYSPAGLRVSQYLADVAMMIAYLLWASGEHGSTRIWHIASGVPLAAALVRFGVLSGRGTNRPVEDMLTRDKIMLACELAGWPCSLLAGRLWTIALCRRFVVI
jgi:decaprenyl-phosphate phosphoribosyltransferase